MRYSFLSEGFTNYALDNDAWTAYCEGRPFDEAAFLAAVGAGAQFIVVPDIVCGGLDPLRLSEAWLPRLAGIGRRRLIAVQNCMMPADLRSLLSSEVGLFVGGDTAWKKTTLPLRGELAREVRCYLHVGRVNSVRRIRLVEFSLGRAHGAAGVRLSTLSTRPLAACGDAVSIPPFRPGLGFCKDPSSTI
jgi:hypothetical protein